MFHLHVLGALNLDWLAPYGGSAYSDNIMGEWFKQLRLDIKIHICYVDHPVHPA